MTVGHFLLARALWKFYHDNWLKYGKKIGDDPVKLARVQMILQETISNGWNIFAILREYSPEMATDTLYLDAIISAPRHKRNISGPAVKLIYQQGQEQSQRKVDLRRQ
jgi:hypothetical protein